MKVNEKTLAKGIGRAISKRRIASGLTQEDVAERLGVGNEAISRMERGSVIPTILRLVELADIFDCPIGELLFETSNRPEDQAQVVTKMLEKLTVNDRAIILDILEKLTDRMRRK